MAKYHVAFLSSAEKELKKLPAQLIARIVPHLENLASNPRPSGCKKLRGGDGEWRIRVGDWRVVYTIDDGKSLVEVTRIRHRSEVYHP
ncbi:Toxin RelE [Candidatus Sulfopaludibacter sp. SbA4]|nr:Toxin RelE [Candidatus Sulfopaludibacter sp. SbA4]